MDCVDQFLTGKSRDPRLVWTSASTDLRIDYETNRIGMQCPLYDLVGHMRSIVVACVNVIDARVDCLPQNSDCGVNITWWSPNSWTRKLHCAVTHPIKR